MWWGPASKPIWTRWMHSIAMASRWLRRCWAEKTAFSSENFQLHNPQCHASSDQCHAFITPVFVFVYHKFLWPLGCWSKGKAIIHKLFINRIIVTPTATLCNYIFAGWQFFVPFDLQLYSTFDDDLQSIWFYSMVMLITTFAKVAYYPREGNALSSRGETILLARINLSLREGKVFSSRREKYLYG